jgi:protocatechuate 3,4-dioxygenase beta subunit
MPIDTASRRRFLTLWLAGTGVALGGGARGQAPLPETPSCGAGATPRQTEGPFYLAKSPKRADLRGDGPGDPLALFGRVLTPDCRPVADAVVDLWHADARGAYDERGFRFRAHQTTDQDGRFAFQSIMPGRYPGRTAHYHVILIKGGRRLLTTQLYFPGQPGNARDGLYTPRLLVNLSDAGSEKAARFDFVVAG